MDIYALIRFFADPTRHFIVAFAVGVLVFCVTAIISTILSKFMAWRGVSRIYTARVTTGMLIISLLVAISFALLSHVALDYFRAWYTTPLGPSLTILK